MNRSTFASVKLTAKTTHVVDQKDVLIGFYVFEMSDVARYFGTCGVTLGGCWTGIIFFMVAVTSAIDFLRCLAISVIKQWFFSVTVAGVYDI